MVPLQPALRSTASPQTVLRRTIDPSPSIVFTGAEHCPPGLLGGLRRVGGPSQPRICAAKAWSPSCVREIVVQLASATRRA